MATRSHSPLFQYIFSSGHKVTFSIISVYFQQWSQGIILHYFSIFSVVATRSHSPLFQHIFSSGHKVTFPIISVYIQQWPQGHILHYFSIFSAVATRSHSPLFQCMNKSVIVIKRFSGLLDFSYGHKVTFPLFPCWIFFCVVVHMCTCISVWVG